MRAAWLLLVPALALPAAAFALPAALEGAIVAQPGSAAFADLAMPDPELAMVAGVARGPEVLGLALGPAPGRVLAVPSDAPPHPGELEPTGRTFAFTDPHGNAWEVVEYRAAWGYAYGTQVGALTDDADAGAYNFVLLVDQTKVGSQVRIVAA